MKKILLLAVSLLLLTIGFAQKYAPNWQSLNTRKMPGWFHQAKFGIFIHWGLYSVPAYAPVLSNSGYDYSEWYWRRIRRDHTEGPEQNEASRQLFTDFHNRVYGKDFKYEQFAPLFKAELYDPTQWARLFKSAGAKYVVLTAKHHEGYCLWNSPEADRDWGRPWNSVTGAPKRDLLGDLTKAVCGEGLKMGVYYSLYEWFNPLWLTDKKKYVTEHMLPQLKELVNQYKPSIIFADGEWDLPDTGWHSLKFLSWLFSESPVKNEVVVDDRWGSNTRSMNNGAMYTTSEYGSGMDKTVTWEQCEGIGHSFGYNRNEQLSDYKTGRDLILMLVDIVSRGGNLLLDVGPTADGRIPVIMQQRLSEIGTWLKINGDAIYGTEAYTHPYQWSKGIVPGKKQGNYMNGYSTSELTRPKNDTAHIEAFYTTKGADLYCTLPAYQPELRLTGIKAPKSAEAGLLGTDIKLPVKQSGNDLVIDLSHLKANALPNKIFTLKLTGVLK